MSPFDTGVHLSDLSKKIGPPQPSSSAAPSSSATTPTRPRGRPLQVVLDGTPAGKATVLDAYANTAVRRVRTSSHIETDEPAPEPPPSRIAMRDLGSGNREND